MINKIKKPYFIGFLIFLIIILITFLIFNMINYYSKEKSVNFVLRPNDILTSSLEREYGLREDIELNFTSDLCYNHFVKERLSVYDLQQISPNSEDWECMIESLELTESYLRGEGLSNFEEEYNIINYAINCKCWFK